MEANNMVIFITVVIVAIGIAALSYKYYNDSIINECSQKYNNSFNEIKANVYNYLQEWCKKENNYSSLIDYLCTQVVALSEIKNRLKNDRYTSDRLKKVNERLTEIQEINSILDIINTYSANLSALKQSVMIDPSEYGKCDRHFYNSVQGLSETEIKGDLGKILSTRFQGDYINSFKIDYKAVVKYLWYYAMKKPFSIEEYNTAVSAYKLVFGEHIKSELLLSELYYIKQLGSDNIINDKIRELFRYTSSRDTLSIIASTLMWIGAFSTEKIVLEQMVKLQCSLTPKQQTRLHSLANSNGNAPNSHDVISNTQTMFIDISSLSWDDDTYNAFFENLAFQDKTLTYSLAVRDDTKDLMIKNASSVPTENGVLASIKETLTNEFGNATLAELKDTVAISGASRESMRGVFVTSRQCKYLGILVYLVPIGRKLNIKFYTLLVPITSNISEVQQQALSLKNNISPSATIWESSLKDSILLAIQHFLNRGTYTTDFAPDKKNPPDDGEVLF